MSSFFAKKDKTVEAPERQLPWVEKYRPKSLDEVSAQDHAITVLKRTMESANVSNWVINQSKSKTNRA